MLEAFWFLEWVSLILHVCGLTIYDD